MYLNNKYTKCYFSIIDKAKSRILDKEIYTETHHIMPKKLGGPDTAENLVVLTAREHFVCHLLLTKMTTGWAYHQMVFASSLMLVSKHGQHRYVPSSRIYQLVKEQASKTISASNKGRTRSLEFCELIRTLKTGTKNPKTTGDNHYSHKEGYVSKISGNNHYNYGKTQTTESNKKRSETLTGFKQSDDHKKRRSDSMKKKIVIDNVTYYGFDDVCNKLGLSRHRVKKLYNI